MSEYHPIRITTIEPNSNLTFNLHIFFKDQYLLYVESGKKIEQEKYDKLKAQKIANFFITQEQEPDYEKYIDHLIEKKLKGEGSNLEEKVKIARGIAETAIENLKTRQTEGTFKFAQKAATSLSETARDNPDFLKKLLLSNIGEKSDEEVIDHCVNVSVLVTKLGQHLGISNGSIDQLATAALLHDIGHLKDPNTMKKYFSRPVEQLSSDERKEYFQHCQHSLELFQGKKFVTDEIAEMIINHEENLAGTGPMQKTKISRPIEILSMCNLYDKNLSSKNMTPGECLKDLQLNQIGNYNLNLLKKFKDMLEKEGVLS